MKQFHNLLLIPREETRFQKILFSGYILPIRKITWKLINNYKPIQSINYNPSLIDYIQTSW